MRAFPVFQPSGKFIMQSQISISFPTFVKRKLSRKAKILYTCYAACEGECETEGGESSLFLICDGTSKSSVNSMKFTFTPIGIGTDSFTTFTFTSILAFAPTKHRSMLTCVSILDTVACCIPSKRNLSLMLLFLA